MPEGQERCEPTKAVSLAPRLTATPGDYVLREIGSMQKRSHALQPIRGSAHHQIIDACN